MTALRETVRRARVDPASRDRLTLAAAAGGAAGIAVLALLGSLHGADARIDVEGFRSEGPWRFFNTDGEANVPTVYSGLLLFAAGFLAASVARSGRAGSPRPWWFIAGVLTFMGLDEGMTIHEHVGYWLGVTWQAAYVPVAIVAIAAWLGVLRLLGSYKRARVLWLAGAAVWLLALVLERIQSDMKEGDTGIRQLALTEEILEMIGSLLFGLALLRVALEVGALVGGDATRTPERPSAAPDAPAAARHETRVASGER